MVCDLVKLEDLPEGVLEDLMGPIQGGEDNDEDEKYEEYEEYEDDEEEGEDEERTCKIKRR